MNYNSTTNQEIKGRFVDREVVYCISTLVYELAQKQECFPDYTEDLMDAYQGLPDYEEAAREEGWTVTKDGLFWNESDSDPQYLLWVNLQERGQVSVSVYSIPFPGADAINEGKEVWSFSGPEDEAVNLDGSEVFDVTDPSDVEAYLIDQGIIEKLATAFGSVDAADFSQTDAETWEELCDEENIDAFDYAPEVYEHWIVSDFLGRKLEEYGERVLHDFFGFSSVWCRTTTGQSIKIDYVISLICAGMEILEGQQHDWAA